MSVVLFRLFERVCTAAGRAGRAGMGGLALLMLAATWSAGAPPRDGEPPSAPAPAPSAPASRDYQLQPGDIVRVQVFQEPDLDRELRVSQDGELTFPLIGRVPAKNRTLSQLEETVRKAYDRDYLVNPQVTIVVLKYRPRTVNVLGMVNQPQAVEIPPEQSLNVLDAVSRAGGFNRYADRRRLRLTRTYGDGRVENFTINADELLSGGGKDQWVVQPDDVIFVPERVL